MIVELTTAQIKVLKWFVTEPVYENSVPTCQVSNVQHLIDIGLLRIMSTPGNVTFASKAEGRRNAEHIKFQGQLLSISESGLRYLKD